MIIGMGSGSAASGCSKPPLATGTPSASKPSAVSALGVHYDFSLSCAKTALDAARERPGQPSDLPRREADRHQLLSLVSPNIRLAPKHTNLTSIYRIEEWQGPDPTRDESTEF